MTAHTTSTSTGQKSIIRKETRDKKVVFCALRPQVFGSAVAAAFGSAVAAADLTGVFLAEEGTVCARCKLALAVGGGGEAAVRRLGGIGWK